MPLGAKLADNHPRVLALPASTVFDLMARLKSATHDSVLCATGAEHWISFSLRSFDRDAASPLLGITCFVSRLAGQDC